MICPSFNLDADINAAKIVLHSNSIKEKHFVWKNVCHGVLYTRDAHQQLQKINDNSQLLQEIYHIMPIYLQNQGKISKAFHDPLTACCAIDLSSGQLKDVKLYMDEKTKEWDQWFVKIQI